MKYPEVFCIWNSELKKFIEFCNIEGVTKRCKYTLEEAYSVVRDSRIQDKGDSPLLVVLDPEITLKTGFEATKREYLILVEGLTDRSTVSMRFDIVEEKLFKGE